MTWRVIEADCIEAMAAMPEASVDAIVTDPPYGLEFMGKAWDRLQTVAADPASVGGFQDGNGGNAYSRSRVRYALGAAQEWHYAWAVEALRVLKPGGHLLAFGGTRTYHRLACAVEDAGFEVRDTLAWLYGSGFPKSLDVSKAIDKLDAVAEQDERAKRSQAWLREFVTPQQVNEVTGTDMGHHLTTHPTQPFVPTPAMLDQLRPLLLAVPAWLEALVADRAVESENMKARQVTGERNGSTMPGFARILQGEPTTWQQTRPHTPDAERWQGWGTALKPAFEPIVVARKPLGERNVAANVLRHGTGALNIDGARVEAEAGANLNGGRVSSVADGWDRPWKHDPEAVAATHDRGREAVAKAEALGRWPANVILDEEAAAMLDEQTGELPGRVGMTQHGSGTNEVFGTFACSAQSLVADGVPDTGGASRFFYCPKADRAERELGLAHRSRAAKLWSSGEQNPGSFQAEGTDRTSTNPHPTVKPVALMAWLVRLVTPPGGTVLDPFTGSGSTGIAALREGFDFVGIEREAEYVEVARDRIRGDAPMFNVPAEEVSA